MSFSNIIKRNYLHTYNKRTVAIIASILFTVVILVLGAIYPGEEGIQGYFSVFVMIATIDVENPGFSVWLIFNNGLLLSIYTAVIGIFIGVNLLPISDKDGKDLIFTTPKTLVSNFLENSIISVILLFLILLPSFLVSVILLYANNAMGALENILIGFVLAFCLTMFFMFLTAFGAALRFSKSTGYLVGGLYFIFALIAELSANSSPDLEFLKSYSMFSQAEITLSSFNSSWNGDFITLCLLGVIPLIFLSIFFLLRRDFIEKSNGISEHVQNEESEDPRKSSRLSNIRKPIEGLLSKSGWSRPIMRDQLHSIAGVFSFFVLFIGFMMLYLTSVYPGEEELTVLLAGFDLPMIRALQFGYPIVGSSAGYLGFEIFSFAFMLIGPYILVVVNNIIFRDKKNRISEITWSLPRNSVQMIHGRTIAALIYLILIFGAGYIILIPMQSAMSMDLNAQTLTLAYLILTWSYCVFFIFYLSLSLLVPYKYSQKILIFSYTISILVFMMAFMTDASILRYLSPFGYFNAVGVLLDEITFMEAAIPGLICTLGSIIFYIYVLIRRIPSRDYLV